MATDDNLQRAQEYWERFEKRHATEKTDGKGYAERQIAKTLSQVPKIDVNMERSDKNGHDTNTKTV